MTREQKIEMVAGLTGMPISAVRWIVKDNDNGLEDMANSVKELVLGQAEATN